MTLQFTWNFSCWSFVLFITVLHLYTWLVYLVWWLNPENNTFFSSVYLWLPLFFLVSFIFTLTFVTHPSAHYQELAYRCSINSFTTFTKCNHLWFIICLISLIKVHRNFLPVFFFRFVQNVSSSWKPKLQYVCTGS